MTLRHIISLVILMGSCPLYAADSYFLYPRDTLIKQSDPALTQLQVKTDILFAPTQTSLKIVDRTEDVGESTYAEICSFSIAAPADTYRRLIKDTWLAVTAINEGGNPEVSGRDRAYVALTLATSGGATFELRCSHWSEGGESGSGSDANVSMDTLREFFDFYRLETVIE